MNINNKTQIDYDKNDIGSAPLIHVNNKEQNENIDYYKQESIELKSKIEMLSKYLGQMKSKYNQTLNINNNKPTETDREKCKSAIENHALKNHELKLLYELSGQHIINNADFFNKKKIVIMHGIHFMYTL